MCQRLWALGLEWIAVGVLAMEVAFDYLRQARCPGCGRGWDSHEDLGWRWVEDVAATGCGTSAA